MKLNQVEFQAVREAFDLNSDPGTSGVKDRMTDSRY